MRPLLALAALSACLAAPLAAQPVSDGFQVLDHEEHGPYLAGPNGRPVYVFLTTGRGGDGLPPLESCTQRCLEEWPLIVAEETPEGGPNVPAELFGTVSHRGKDVLTYGGRPLFTFALEDGDLVPDGHAVHTWGGWWALVRPDGMPIRTGIMPNSVD